MLLFYVRHGDPTYNPDCLTALGRRQAEAVGRRLATFGINKIYSSTSTRAIQTSQPACEMLKIDRTEMEFCHENLAWKDLALDVEEGRRMWAFDIPEYRCMFLEESVKRMGNQWYDHPHFKDTRFKQGMERIRRETDAWLASLGYEHDREANCFRAVRPNEDRVALFAHAGFGLAFLSTVLDIPYPQMCIHFDMCHTGMTVIEFKETHGVVIPKVLTLSNDGHLLRDGMPTNYNNLVRF
ncbi:MAG: histidine phosphatase family protein [Clostridia bacterium]|nr:histidine phosphatase family protein [Clostridia bacterium]